MNKDNKFKSGFVAILGKPNVGKSTLLNAFLGEKLSIVTPKAQTTRNKVTGILTGKNYQIVFLDTPGIFEPSYKLQEHMVNNAMKSASDADLVLIMVEGFRQPDDIERSIIQKIRDMKKEIILVINKIDKIPQKDELLPIIETYNIQFGFEEIVPISALKLNGISHLLNLIIDYLPEGQLLYPEDDISDLPERFFIAEMIREKIVLLTQQEIPYSTTVITEEVKERNDGKIYIRASIYVERDSQRGILIGNKGSMLKKIGQYARTEIEKWMEANVYLDLWVGVKEDWREKESYIREFGYS
jgi:GTP-binding protein Era